MITQNKIKTKILVCFLIFTILFCFSFACSPIQNEYTKPHFPHETETNSLCKQFQVSSDPVGIDQPTISFVATTDNLLVVWSQKNAITGRLYDSVKMEPISKEIEIANSQSLSIPSVGFFNETHFVLVYKNDSTPNSESHLSGQILRIHLNGTDSEIHKVGSDFQINGEGESQFEHDDPKVSILDEDYFMVVWMCYCDSEDDENGDIYGQFIKLKQSGGEIEKIGNQTLINTYIPHYQAIPQIEKLSQTGEKFVVVWDSYGQDGSGDGIYGQFFKMDNSATGSEHIEKIGSEFRINTYTKYDQMNPQITSLANFTKFVVVWVHYHSSSSDYGNSAIVGQVFDSKTGSTIGQEFRIKTYSWSYDTQPDVSSASNNQFVIAWGSNQYDKPQQELYLKLFNVTQQNEVEAIGNEFKIVTNSDNDQYSPSMTKTYPNPGSKIALTWSSNGKFMNQIQAKILSLPIDYTVQINKVLKNQTIGKSGKLEYQFDSDTFQDTDDTTLEYTFAVFDDEHQLRLKEKDTFWVTLNSKERKFSFDTSDLSYQNQSFTYIIDVTASNMCTEQTESFQINLVIDQSPLIISSVVSACCSVIICGILLGYLVTKRKKGTKKHKTKKNQDVQLNQSLLQPTSSEKNPKEGKHKENKLNDNLGGNTQYANDQKQKLKVKYLLLFIFLQFFSTFYPFTFHALVVRDNTTSRSWMAAFLILSLLTFLLLQLYSIIAFLYISDLFAKVSISNKLLFASIPLWTVCLIMDIAILKKDSTHHYALILPILSLFLLAIYCFLVLLYISLRKKSSDNTKTQDIFSDALSSSSNSKSSNQSLSD
ncbi:beta-4c adrenergic receptor-like [Anaeramoeba flamelloides]|uniref:Beta-4c adrenergic receptor-like n=1 Tax=Anaeramoeba flamelloides TaxID=1746091 RepID=A0AAV8A3F4_9EUKA|nr:beta-4c adrenergic receptor-like [Anaeramoeba flamelloides]